MSTSYTAKGDEQGNVLKPYKVYTALLTQSGTNAPIATVLENTLGGDIVWSRDDIGVYYGTLVGAFTENKTILFTTVSDRTLDRTNLFATRIDNNIVQITSFLPTDGNYDGLINDAIEIRVYN